MSRTPREDAQRLAARSDDGMTSFARRQPAAFLGLSVLAGFAVVRFLKASGSTLDRRSTAGRLIHGGAEAS